MTKKDPHLISLTYSHQRVQELLSQTEARERQKQDQFVNTVSHSLSQTIANNLERSVKTEFRGSIVPSKLNIQYSIGVFSPARSPR